ncbi:MAG: xanthine dehydrogenase family protein subunit M [Clostridia bacterium]|nr:xanthine dehydrogenase family protein subunit M [Clostridia bacterium]
MPQEYLLPASIEECLHMLAVYPGGRIIAGGTDLMLDLREGRKEAKALIDITRIGELKRISADKDRISIGAAVTHAEVAASELIRQRLPALAAAAGAVGSPQVRNVGTLGGNIVNAQPAADTAVALVALGARAVIVSAAGERQVAVEDLYAGVGRSQVDASKEILTKFIIDLWGAGDASAFARLARRRTLSLPVLNVAVRVKLKEGRCTRARVCLAPVVPRPLPCQEAASVLIGQPPTEEVIARAAAAAKQAAHPRDSLLRGPANYRKDMVEVLLKRALREAFGLPAEEDGHQGQTV